MSKPVIIGADVGSTTVKSVVVDPATRRILWSSYGRHETKQAEKLSEQLEAIGREFDVRPEARAHLHHRLGR